MYVFYVSPVQQGFKQNKLSLLELISLKTVVKIYRRTDSIMDSNQGNYGKLLIQNG